MRRFYLQRSKDETGISGAGRVLDGVVFSSGRVMIEWQGEFKSVTVHDSMESFKAVHMSPHHPTSNSLVWIDDAQQACRCGHPLSWHLTGGPDGRLEYCEGSANGLCNCGEMQPVQFAEKIPDKVGYFGHTTVAPIPPTLTEALTARGGIQ